MLRSLRASGYILDRHELAGALADIGVFVPIAVALIVANGLSATAVLLPAAVLYLGAALIYRLPVPVQPLKAFGAIAIAKGLGADEIAAGALLMGVIFTVLGRSGAIDLAARAFPRALIRGVQITVGFIFLKIAWGLVTDAPKSFASHAASTDAALLLAAVTMVLLLALRRHLISLVLVAIGVVAVALEYGGSLQLGPSAIAAPHLSGDVLLAALTVLVIPQLPLTFANSCVATADAARKYFPEQADRVRAGRLATSLGAANLFSGAIAGMPVCHGAGGLTAHRTFGARSGGAPLIMGLALLALAFGLGASLAGLLAAFPLWILAGLLGSAGILHIGLARDLAGAREWSAALAAAVCGLLVNLAVGLAVGLLLWWSIELALRLRAGRVHQNV